MKALSLWEPWASLMATGAKKIETRSWGTSYRGPLLICASRRRHLGELIHHLCIWQFQGCLAPLVGEPLDLTAMSWPGVKIEHLQFGNAVALVDLVDCKPTGALTLDEIGTDGPFGDYSRGRFAWITTNLRRLQPFSVRGKQGLFEVDVPVSALGAHWNPSCNVS